MKKKKGGLKKLRARFETARKQIHKVKKDGANIASATALLTDLEKCLEKGDETEAAKILSEINLQVKQAKAKKKYEMMIFNSLPMIEKAKRAGANVEASEALLDKAKELLEAGEFGDAHEQIKLARREADNAKRFMTAKSKIQRASPLVEAAKKKGVDVKKATNALLDAWKALEEGNYKIVSDLIKKATTFLSIAEEQKNYEISIRDMEARVGAVAESGMDTKNMEDLLDESKKALEREDFGDVRTTVNKIRREIERIILHREAGLTVRTIQQFVREAKRAGLKSGELEDMLEKASVAVKSGDFSQVRAVELSAKQAVKNLKLFDTLSTGDIGVVDKEREEGLTVLAKEELAESERVMERARASGMDVSEIEGLIRNAEDAMNAGQLNRALETVRDINRIIHDEDSGFKSVEAKKKLLDIFSALEEAKAIGIDVSEAEVLATQAKAMEKEGRHDDISGTIKKAALSLDDAIKKGNSDKHPRLRVGIRSEGFETQRWGKAHVELSNTGNSIAKNIDLQFFGDMDVKGWQTVSKLLPGQKYSREIALKTFKHGKVPLDMTVNYEKSFDNTKFQLNDMKDVDVTEPGTFLVGDVFLIHNNGLLISKQTRRIKEEVDGDLFSAMLKALMDFVRQTFNISKKGGLDRMDFSGEKLLIEKGRFVFLAITVAGDESAYLPFFMTELTRNIEDRYGAVLEDWNGEMKPLEGIEDMIKEIIFVKNTGDENIPILESSILAPLMGAISEGSVDKTQIEDIENNVARMTETLEGKGMEAALAYLTEMESMVGKLTAAPGTGRTDGGSMDADTLKEKICDIMAWSDHGDHDSAFMDTRLNNYLEVMRKVSDAVSGLRERNGIPAEQTLARIAIKHPDRERWSEVLGIMRTLVREQTNAMDVQILGPDETWSGLKPTVKINEGLIVKSYRHIAKKIISILKYMPPDKLLAGIKKGMFAIGIEGQQVYISDDMISVSFSLPSGAYEGQVDSGVIYIDTAITEEVKTDMSANALTEKILAMRQEAEIEEGAEIEVQVLAGDELVEMLEKSKDMIMERCGAYDVLFPLDDPFGGGEYHVDELELEGETCKVGIVQVEFDD